MDFIIKVKGLIRGRDIFDIEKALEEKRFFPRIKCALEGRCSLEDGQKFHVHIKEVSLLGMRLASGRKLKTGDIVTVEPIKGRGILSTADFTENAIRMEIVWARKGGPGPEYLCGLQFADDKKRLKNSWIAYILDRYGISVAFSTQKRKWIRLDAEIPASIMHSRGRAVGIIRDIGIGGMLIDTRAELQKNEEIRFQIGPYRHIDTLLCEGRIIHGSYKKTVDSWIYGIIFENLTRKQAKLLNSYLSTLIVEG
jgi:hypothetical protein